MRQKPARAWILLFLISVVIIVLGQQLGHRDGLLLSVAVALSINAILFFYGDLRLVPLLQSSELEGQDPWGLLNKVQDLAEKARVPTPRIFLINSSSPQSLVLGRSVKSGKMFLTEGLLRQLTKPELHAILAYNIACIKTMATLSFTVASALADAVLTLGNAMDRILNQILGSRSKERTDSRHFGSALSAPIAAVIVRLAVSRSEYLAADQLAAQLSGSPKALATALWKLYSYSYTQPITVHPAASPFFVVNPLTKQGFNRYFHAQPSLKVRIENLLGYYPI